MSEEKVQQEKKEKVIKEVWIADDYVATARVKETIDYSEFTFMYKPMTVLQISVLTDAVMKSDTIVASTEEHAKIISTQVVEWSLQKPDGNAIDFTNVKDVLRLKSPIFNRIASIIKGDSNLPAEDMAALQDELKN